MIIHVKTILDYFGDIFFPPREDELVVRSLTTDAVQDCLEIKTIEQFGIALTSFQNPVIRALVHEAKFHYNSSAFTHLSKLIPQHNEEDTIYVPIPLSQKRYRERGYNQVHEILKRMPDIKIDPKTLYRKINTAPQTTLSRTERLRNMTNAFAVRQSRANFITGKNIILIDDVVTTGATFQAAKAALLPYSPASVRCIAIAH